MHRFSLVGEFAKGQADLAEIPPEASYLTLAVAAVHDGAACDHGVWSGARIEVEAGLE